MLKEKPVGITNPTTSLLQPSRFFHTAGNHGLGRSEYQHDLVFEISEYVPDIESGEL
jgi:hypothetical protein